MPAAITPNPGPAQIVPVAHSILDASALATLCITRYALPAETRGQLLVHGQNDWYCLEAATERWAVRVLKSGSRSHSQLNDELQWQRGLGSSFPTPAPLATLQGTLLLLLRAPEGERFACLYPWLPGRTLDRQLQLEDARDAGHLLAVLHAHDAQLPPGGRRHDLDAKLAATAAALDAAVAGTAATRLVAAARQQARAALDQLPSLPQGSLHGDLHFGNLRRDDANRLWLLDFDDCGRGPLCVDLTAFIWRNRCERLPRALDAAFVAGYESLRTLTATERAALPGLQVARALYLAGVLARDRDRLGKVAGFDRPWPHYLDLIQEALDDAVPS